MAAPSRPQPQRNGRSLRRRIVDTIRATVKRMRPINRLRGQATRQTGTIDKDTHGRLRSLRDRGVAGIRQLVGQGVTTTRSLPTRAGRQLGRLAWRGRDQASATRPIPSTRGRERGAAERAAPTQRHQDEPAKARAESGGGNASPSLGRSSAGRASSSRPSSSCASGPGRPASRVASR